MARYWMRLTVIAFVVAAVLSLACFQSGCEHKESDADMADQLPLSHADIAGKPALKANARDLQHTIVTSHLEQRIEPDTNVLWCSTFQLAWNEFCDLAEGPISLENEPPMVAILNKRTASKRDVDEASYVALAGFAEEGIYDKIRGELQRKFMGAADPRLLDETPQLAEGAVAYAYLFKALPFRWAFTRWSEARPWPTDTDARPLDWFGIGQGDTSKEAAKLASQVVVLDYRNNDDFILELKTRAPEERLILAKTPPRASIGETVKMVEKRMERSTPRELKSPEWMKIPILDFDIFREYGELYGKPIKATNRRLDGLSILFARQMIRFRLDETGAVLKSEGLIAACAAPREFVFDKPFLILLRRADAKMPYFALWVGNAELLVSSKKPVLSGDLSVPRKAR